MNDWSVGELNSSLGGQIETVSDSTELIGQTEIDGFENSELAKTYQI